MAANSATFPQKLHELISEDCNHDIIRWVNGGKAFKVVNAEGFEHEIVPKYFRHTKLTSFQRQLNLYGFRRMNKGEFQGAYFHNNFVENRKDLLVAVKRASTKGNKEGHHSPILTDVDGVNSLAQLLNSGLAEDGGINMDGPFDGHVTRPMSINSSSSSSYGSHGAGGAAQFQSTFVKRQKVSHQYVDNGASYIGSEGDDSRGSSSQNQQQHRGQSGGNQHQQYHNQNQQYQDDGQGQYGNAGNIYDMNHPQFPHGGGYGSAGPPTSGPGTVSDGRTSNNYDSSRGGGGSTSNNQSAQQHASDNTSGSGGDNPRGFPRYPKVQPPDNANGLPNNARMSVPTTVPLPPHPFLLGGKAANSSSSSATSTNSNSDAGGSRSSSSSRNNGSTEDNNGPPTIQIPPPPQHKASNQGGGSSGSRSASGLGPGAGPLLGPPMTAGASSIMPHLFREISANTQDELRTLLLPGPDSMDGGRGGSSMLHGGNGGADSMGATFLDSINSNSSFLDQDQETGSFAASASAKGYKPNLARTISDGQWGPAVDIEKSSSTSADAAINNLEFTDGDGGGIATSGIAAAGTSSSTSSSNNGVFSPSGKARPPLQDGSTPQKDGPPSSASRRNNALEMLSVVAYQRSTSMEGEATPNSGHAGGLGGIKSLPQAKLQMNVTNAPLDAVEAEPNATDDLIWGKR